MRCCAISTIYIQQETFKRVDTFEKHFHSGAHSVESVKCSPMISSFKYVLLLGFKDFHCDYWNIQFDSRSSNVGGSPDAARLLWHDREPSLYSHLHYTVVNRCQYFPAGSSTVQFVSLFYMYLLCILTLCSSSEKVVVLANLDGFSDDDSDNALSMPVDWNHLLDFHLYRTFSSKFLEAIYHWSYHWNWSAVPFSLCLEFLFLDGG